MIHGIGTDIVDIERIRAAYAKHGVRFAERLLSPAERIRLSELSDPAPFLAKRWAAKEAFGKALGTGIRPPIALSGITVVNNDMGRPALAFDSAISAYLTEHGIAHVHLSLSDERASALAFVVVESG